MNDAQREMYDSLFSLPLTAVDSAGKLQQLDWDQSEEPILFDNEGVPVAVLKLTNGNGAKLRFDVNPPRLSGFDFKPDRFLIDEVDFIDLVNATRAGRSLESYLFAELFKYPFKALNEKTGELKKIIVGTFKIYNADGVPIALFSHPDSSSWTPVRFDYDPPRICGLNCKSAGEMHDKDQFVKLVRTSREDRIALEDYYRLNEAKYSWLKDLQD